MHSVTESILQVIQQNSEWAWLIVFFIAFIESMAIVGLFMPGWILLVGIGTMIGADLLEFLPIVISAYLGAVIGEYLSYQVGYHYHETILKWKIVAKHQKLIDNSRVFFEKHGAAGVFFGRFIGPVRAVMPLIAGISEMPKKTFFWVNISSGIIWAPIYLIPGILIGAAYDLDKEIATFLLFILSLVGLVLWMAIKQSKIMLAVLNGRLQRDLRFAKMNVILAWLILIVLLVILKQSVYFEFIQAIFVVLWSKLL